jgi:tRNA A37 N6-isopentenylltransferase MiaA
MTITEATYIEFYQQAWSNVEKMMKKGLAQEIKVAATSRISALRGDIRATDVEKIMDHYKKQILGREF